MLLVLGLQCLEVVVEAVKAFLPEAAVAIEPVVDAFEGGGLDPAGPPLRRATARDQAGSLQHLEMLGNGRAADVEGLGKLGHRGFAQSKPPQDGTAGGIGERRKGGAEGIGRHGVMYQSVK